MATPNDDRGHAMVVTMLVAAALFLAMTSVLGELGTQMVDRTRAQTAADAAALASLDGGRRAAHLLAERHGAELVAYATQAQRGRVTVVVRIGEATASAAASDVP